MIGLIDELVWILYQKIMFLACSIRGCYGVISPIMHLVQFVGGCASMVIKFSMIEIDHHIYRLNVGSLGESVLIPFSFSRKRTFC